LQDTRGFAALQRRGDLTLAQWVQSIAHWQRFLVVEWRDPWPTLSFNAARVARRIRRLTG
jgi:hypothetical protein